MFLDLLTQEIYQDVGSVLVVTFLLPQIARFQIRSCWQTGILSDEWILIHLIYISYEELNCFNKVPLNYYFFS